MNNKPHTNTNHATSQEHKDNSVQTTTATANHLKSHLIYSLVEHFDLDLNVDQAAIFQALTANPTTPNPDALLQQVRPDIVEQLANYYGIHKAAITDYCITINHYSLSLYQYRSILNTFASVEQIYNYSADLIIHSISEAVTANQLPNQLNLSGVTLQHNTKYIIYACHQLESLTLVLFLARIDL